MRFSSIGSGSAGNGLLIEQGSTRLLLDCGFGLRDAEQRLARINITPDQLTGILITHEHEDHAGGVFKLARKYRIPVWLTHGTFKMIEKILPAEPIQLNIIDSHSRFNIHELEVSPYPVPHDAREPVQYVFSNGDKKLGVLTDTGCSTPHIQNMLSGCHALMLECNHDLEMLMNGIYPMSLKQRVSGRLGHLDNISAANILSKLDNHHLKHIIAAHLSEKNNTPALAISALSNALNCEKNWIGIAEQDKGFDWREI
ncbi:MBL fold metallo-hydrolase [Candidatus Methylopumilus turicensis]|uniref:Beta-lactamase domain protein n=1 Tax=Candidatus Methylopumilus turicensis TaxID=1581680 RepID=A0A0B7J079_9PROT|nr:MBL fold metallo-hydrolase [Candidatus Methylopumilus turicensis]CEN56137.1 Beta-lactamase domain protein [Candidatus Methylopumilus turicensis]